MLRQRLAQRKPMHGAEAKCTSGVSWFLKSGSYNHGPLWETDGEAPVFMSVKAPVP